MGVKLRVIVPLTLLAMAVLGGGGYWAWRGYLKWSYGAEVAEAIAEREASYWPRKRAEMQDSCHEIAARAEVKARDRLGLRDGESLWRQRVEVFMDRETAMPTIIAQVRAGGWPARYAMTASGSVAAEYDRYTDPMLNDAWVQAAAGNESLCVLY